MIKEMEQGQVEFEENLDSLEGTVQNFSTYDEMEKYLETFKDVEAVNQRLKDCMDLAMLYNK